MVDSGLTLERERIVRRLNLAGVALGLVAFGVGAAMLSVLALAGIVLAAACGVAFTWVSLGQRAVVRGVGSGLVGALVAWVAMRSMMRWVALSSGLSPVLTLEGTSAILATSVVMSMLPAMGYLYFRKRFGHSFTKGLWYGLLLSVVGGLPVLLLVSGEINAIAREPLIPTSFLLGVPVVYALTLEATHRALRNY